MSIWKHISYWTAIATILLLWAIRWGWKTAPEIRSTADKIVNLNNLQNVDLNGKIMGCVPFYIKGNV